MKSFTALAALLATTAPLVRAHGQVHSVVTSYGTYPVADAYAAVNPASPMRKLNTYGPAADFTGADITCGPGGNVPVANLAQVDAGGVVSFVWQNWNSVHPGPVMTYMAECVGGCASFKGDTGNVWVKIDQDAYNGNRGNVPWGENVIRMNTQFYNVTVPAGLKSGEYIIRHEILGLHVAYQVMGAQFYPNCLQVKVNNGGSVSLPAGIPFPGSYDPQDPGILVQLYQITPQTPNYVAPGGPVLLAGGSGDWANAAFGTPVTSSTPPLTTVPPAQPSKSSSPPPASVPPSSASSHSVPLPSSSAVAQHYAQCGGQGWTGPTVCVAGTTCTALNTFYSQCI